VYGIPEPVLLRGGQDGDAKHRVGREGGLVRPQKKIVTLPKLGLFLDRKAQEACLLQSIDLTVVQNVLSLFRSIFFNGISPFPSLSHLQNY
jgi:hypothetical protein